MRDLIMKLSRAELRQARKREKMCDTGEAGGKELKIVV